MATDVLCCLFGGSELDRAALGVLGAGQKLSRELGGNLHAVVLGPASPALAEGLAPLVDVVHRAEHAALAEYNPEAYLATLTEVAKGIGPAAVLLGNDTYSQELTPRLAHRLGGSAVGDVAVLAAAGGSLVARRGVYGGKAVAAVKLLRSPGVLWLRARAMPAAQARDSRAEVQFPSLDLPGTWPARLVEKETEGRTAARLEDARVIVSGGRGLGGPEPFGLLAQLAEVMGAQVAASRAACDSGWVPPTWQVGQTGKKVAPTLYLAVAISGASQHLIGIADSQVIAAINTDADAPIFKHCRFGIVEDYRKVVGPLREILARIKG